MKILNKKKQININTDCAVICSYRTQPKFNLVQVNAFLKWIVWIMTTTNIFGYLNFSRVIESSIGIAQRAIVGKKTRRLNYFIAQNWVYRKQYMYLFRQSSCVSEINIPFSLILFFNHLQKWIGLDIKVQSLQKYQYQINAEFK